jgi:hypothetical protein
MNPTSEEPEAVKYSRSLILVKPDFSEMDE